MTFLWILLILVALAVVVSVFANAMPRRTRIIERDVAPRNEEVVVERRPRRVVR